MNGIGIALLHDYIVASDLKEGRLVEILGDYMEPKKTIPLFIAYLQTKHLDVKIRKFIDFIVEILEKHTP